jgi:leader peptidase (prepilin peptidase)/N-methyltransferase
MNPLDFAATPHIFVALSLALGLAIGSFLNVVIHRLPKMMESEWQREAAELRGETPPAPIRYSLVRPGSACPACGHRLRPLENIPLLSYAALRGRCSACKVRISARYPIVEALTGLGFAFSAWHFGFGWAAAGAMFFVACMVALTLIDLDTLLLPDSITLLLLWAGLLINLRGTFTSLPAAVIGAVCGYLALRIVADGFKLIMHKEGMGAGDFKLLAAIGAWLGWKALPLVILLSSLVGAAVGLTLIVLAGRSRDVQIPYGPYLAGAGTIALFWGDNITERYLALFG